MISSDMLSKSEMRATAVDGGGKVAKLYIGLGTVLHSKGLKANNGLQALGVRHQADGRQVSGAGRRASGNSMLCLGT